VTPPMVTRRETEDFIFKNNMKEVSISTIRDCDESAEKSHGYNRRYDCFRVSLDNTPTDHRIYDRSPVSRTAFADVLEQIRQSKEDLEEEERQKNRIAAIEMKFQSLRTQYSPAKNIQKTIQASSNPRKVNKSSSITNILQGLSPARSQRSPMNKPVLSSPSPNKNTIRPAKKEKAPILTPPSKQRLDTISEAASALLPSDQLDTKKTYHTGSSKKSSMDYTATRTTLGGTSTNHIQSSHRRTMTDSTNFKREIETYEHEEEEDEDLKPRDEELLTERRELMDAFAVKKNSLLAYLRGVKERGAQMKKERDNLQLKVDDQGFDHKRYNTTQCTPKEFLVSTTESDVNVVYPKALGRIKQNMIEDMKNQGKLAKKNGKSASISIQKSTGSPKRLPVKQESPPKEKLRLHFPKHLA